jgi:predicted PurR-regulated permease PerM
VAGEDLAMSDDGRPAVPVTLGMPRARLGWWVVVVALGAAVAGFLLAFVGTFVSGLFVYYGVRPLHRRVRTYVRHRGVAASLTLLFVVVPLLALVGYSLLVAVREFVALAGPGLTDAVVARLSLPGDPQRLSAVVADPLTYVASLDDLGGVRAGLLAGFRTFLSGATGLLHLTLALAFVFFLLRDGPRLAEWFRAVLADEDDGSVDDSVAVAYLVAVDADLERVYFGNVLTIGLVTLAAVVVYNGFVVVAPSPLVVPFPTLLALLTGLATFIPLVVGKVVYLPVTGYLLVAAARAGGGDLFAYPLAFLAVAFVFLDLLPQTVLRPYVSARSLHTGLVLFAYVLGAALFGWYGLFLGPLLAVAVVQAANVVLPELLHGERLTPSASSTIHIGTDPRVHGSDGWIWVGGGESLRPREATEGGDESGRGGATDDAGDPSSDGQG